MNVTQVKQNINNIYERRKLAIYALALQYAARAINFFRSVQPPKPSSEGLFWTNRTGQAAARMFTNAEMADNVISWFMAHGVQYGVYLELANDRRFAAINPILEEYAIYFIQDVRKLYKDAA